MLCGSDSSPRGGEVGHTSGLTVTSPPRDGAVTVSPHPFTYVITSNYLFSYK